MAEDGSSAYVQSFYTKQGKDCAGIRLESVNPYGGLIDFTFSDTIKGGGSQQFPWTTDLRNFGLGSNAPDLVLPGSTYNVMRDGKVCYLSIDEADSAVNAAQYVGYKILDSLFLRSFNLFFNIQNIQISQKPVTQVQQTFDGIYAGVYGGGIGSVKLNGITQLWSGLTGNMQTYQPVNLEIEVIEKLMILLSNARGLVFNFHDGFQARKWPCIPMSFVTKKSADNPNIQTYDISFLCSSFNQSFRHQNASGRPNLFGLVGMSGYPRRNAT